MQWLLGVKKKCFKMLYFIKVHRTKRCLQYVLIFTQIESFWLPSQFAWIDHVHTLLLQSVLSRFRSMDEIPVLTEMYLTVCHLEGVLPMVIHQICHFISQCSEWALRLTPVLTLSSDTLSCLIGGDVVLLSLPSHWIHTRPKTSVSDSLLVCETNFLIRAEVWAEALFMQSGASPLSLCNRITADMAVVV